MTAPFRDSVRDRLLQRIDWPRPLGPAAMHGIVGEFVRAVEPNSEADPAALALTFLAAAANAAGRGPHLEVGDDDHHSSLFVCIVGKSGEGRKGTSLSSVRKVMALADPAWASDCISSGAVSGEGIISQVRDDRSERSARYDDEGQFVGYAERVVEAGVADKRRLFVLPEFAAFLQPTRREGNTLSAITRQAWDGARLETGAKNSPVTATDAHLGFLAHITFEELSKLLGGTELSNGFANRYLFVCSRRSKLVAEPRPTDPRVVESLAARVGEALAISRRRGAFGRSPAFRAAWSTEYERLVTADRHGVLAMVTERAPAQVLRLALVYAVLDGVAELQLPHLEAALEVWRYCEDSARRVFGDGGEDRDGLELAERVARPLQEADGATLTRTELRERVRGGKHIKAPAFDAALQTLERAGLIVMEIEPGPRGATRVRWVGDDEPSISPASPISPVSGIASATAARQSAVLARLEEAGQPVHGDELAQVAGVAGTGLVVGLAFQGKINPVGDGRYALPGVEA